MGSILDGDSMLLELRILNGVLSPKFDKYNNIYSVVVDSDVRKLDIDYKADADYTIDIVGNGNFIYGDNEVIIRLKKDDIENTYKLIVYREREQAVFSEVKEAENVIVENPVSDNIEYIIGGSCLLIILIVFLLMFRKKKVG